MEQQPSQGPMVNIRKQPLPEGLDPGDTEQVRTWMRAVLEHEVQQTGRPVPRVQILCEDKLVNAPMDGLFEVGQEEAAAAYWHALGELEGAAHRLRMGTVLLNTGGAMRTVAFAMTWEPHIDTSLQVGDELPGLPGFGVRWWLAYRPYGQGEGGTGVLHGEWTELEGVGFEGLDEPFRELLDAGRVRISLPPLDWQVEPGLDIDTEWIMRAPQYPKPDSATGYAEELMQFGGAQALKGGIDCLWVFAMHDEWLEWWQIKGIVPCTLDDVVRNVCAFASAEAMGVVQPGAHKTSDGTTKRSIHVVAEFEGFRVQHVLTVDFGDDGAPSPGEGFMWAPVEVSQDERSIGVEAGHDLELRTLGIIRKGPGPEIAEG